MNGLKKSGVDEGFYNVKFVNQQTLSKGMQQVSDIVGQ